MPIYTKTGDKGSTSLFDGTRVKKSADRVETYGTFDELNALISLSEKNVRSQETKDVLLIIQNKLFLLCAEVATIQLNVLQNKSDSITADDIHLLEQVIDDYTEKLPKITNFVLLGRSQESAQLHVARTVCRRAERQLIRLSEQEDIRDTLIQYVNRLSDCLYIMARLEDQLYHEQQIIDKVIQKYKIASNQREDDISVHTAEDSLRQQVMRILDRAVQQAQQFGVHIVVTIVDDQGHLVMSYRMKESLLVSIDVAQKKAYTAVALKSATKDLAPLVEPGAPLYSLAQATEDKIITFAGGIPIYDNHVLIGGLGISGGTLEQDQAIAEYALG